jgi:hypothetical protein
MCDVTCKSPIILPKNGRSAWLLFPNPNSHSGRPSVAMRHAVLCSPVVFVLQALSAFVRMQGRACYRGTRSDDDASYGYGEPTPSFVGTRF